MGKNRSYFVHTIAIVFGITIAHWMLWVRFLPKIWQIVTCCLVLLIVSFLFLFIRGLPNEEKLETI